MLNIGAFTFNYDHVEDRILLVGNLNNGQPRIDFWMTRKLTLRLLEAAKGLVEKTSSDISQQPEVHKANLAQFHHEHAKQHMELQNEKAEVSAVTNNLLHRLDISHKEGRYKVLFFASEDTAIAESVLSYPELHQVLHLIHRGAQVLDWGADEQLFERASNTPILQ